MVREWRFGPSVVYTVDDAVRLAITRWHAPYHPSELHARPHDTDEYRETAARCGYGADTWALCWQHEALHHLLAPLLGYPWSPTLRAVSLGLTWNRAGWEEGIVMECQRLLNLPENELPDGDLCGQPIPELVGMLKQRLGL